MSVAGVLGTVVVSLGMLFGSSQGSSGWESMPEPRPVADCSPIDEGENSGPVGVWGCDGSAQPHIRLSQDGRVTGYDGCHRFHGQWRSEGGETVFPEMIITLRGCGWDIWFTEMARVSGDAMYFYDSAGNEIGTLERR